MKVKNLTRWMALLATGFTAHAVLAQSAANYPERTVEVLVPYAAGGGVDAMARTFATEAARVTGQQWVTVNREGGGGVVGFNALVRAKPDGYTVAFSPASPMTNAPFVNSKIPFRNDEIEPVCQVFENVFAIAVRADSPIQNLQDLIARAKAEPGKLSFGHAGPASVGHLSVAAVERSAGVKFNAIAYRGDAPALADTLGATLDFSALGVGTVAGQKLRVLAVLSAKRHPAFPDVPSVTESGYAASSQGLNGVYVPAGTPRPVVQRLEQICRDVVASPAFVERAKAQSQVTSYLDAQAFKTLIEKTYKDNAALVPELKLEKN